MTLPLQCKDIGEQLSSQVASEKRDNRQCLLKVLSNLRYLARQGIAIRGDGDESNSNFMQLLRLRQNEDPRIKDWIDKKTNKYVSHEIQNEVLKVMAFSHLRKIAHDIASSAYFSIMCDECTDSSNREQLSICIRWVNSELEPQEDFIGLYKMASICASDIVSSIKDILLRINLSLANCRGQCYDGASTMRGVKHGVAKLISDEYPKAVYTHCYGHALNLAAGDAIKKCKIMKDALDIVFEVSKLIKYSPKRDVQFESLKQNLAPDTPGFRVLCPTRWTVRANSLKSVTDNYAVLQTLWETAKDETSDTSIKARIIGVEAQFKTYAFFFGVHLGYLILKHTDSLSQALQSPKLSASEGQHIASMTVTTLETLRNETNFKLFWQKVNLLRASFDIEEPKLPRKRRKSTN